MKTSLLRQVKTNLVFFAILSLLIFTNCIPQPDDNQPTTENEYIYDAFKEWYLWYDQLPNIDPNSFSTQKELLENLLVHEDRWSFTGKYSEIKKLLSGGEYKGFGAGFKIDYDKTIRITHVYNNSPFSEFGAKRGWIIETVNGLGIDNLDSINKALNADKAVEFAIITDQGERITKTVSKVPIVMNTILHSNVFEKDNHVIGYFVYDAFLNTSKEELENVFTQFNDRNITDLIIDLRYNGGGVVDIGYQLIAMIGGTKVEDQLISKTTHNNKKSSNDILTYSKYNGTKININKVYFLTTNNTASASELVINALTPFMEVKIIGSTTHGKPVGMYVFSVEKYDLAIAPICFKSANKNGYGDYYYGINAHIFEVDDLKHNWGDPNEAMLKTAIQDITTPVISSANTLKQALINKQQSFEYSGINQYINAW